MFLLTLIIFFFNSQGGASEGGVPLTAYVTLAMLENKVSDPQAIKYLEDAIESIKV